VVLPVHSDSYSFGAFMHSRTIDRLAAQL